MQTGKDTVVALRYSMKNGRGEVLEDTTQSNPIHYLHGAMSILPLLQKQLEGSMAGDTVQVVLSKSNAEADDDFIFDVIIDSVRSASPEEVMLGYPLQISSEVCEADCSCYPESQTSSL